MLFYIIAKNISHQNQKKQNKNIWMNQTKTNAYRGIVSIQ